MIFSTLRLVAPVLVLLMAGHATAGEWVRSGPNGSVTRTYEPGQGATINRQGVNGGGSTANVTCTRGGACQRDWQATAADGRTVSGQRESWRSRFGRRSVNTVTGPNGNTATRYRARPRAVFPRVRRW